MLLAPVCCFEKLNGTVYGPFGQNNMHRTLDFCPDHPGRIKCTKAKK